MHEETACKCGKTIKGVVVSQSSGRQEHPQRYPALLAMLSRGDDSL